VSLDFRTRQADQARIFLPFEKISQYSHNPGLGLAFASQYVATLGGTLQLVESIPEHGSSFKIRIPNPVLASCWPTHKSRKTLPSGWSYWINATEDLCQVGQIYGHSLRNIDIVQAPSSSQATLLVQPMTILSKPQTNTPDFLAPNQLLLMLGWEDDYHTKVPGREASNRTVYGRLPWTRHRLVETIMQAQKMLVKYKDEQKQIRSEESNGHPANLSIGAPVATVSFTVRVS